MGVHAQDDIIGHGAHFHGHQHPLEGMSGIISDKVPVFGYHRKSW